MCDSHAEVKCFVLFFSSSSRESEKKEEQKKHNVIPLIKPRTEKHKRYNPKLGINREIFFEFFFFLIYRLSFSLYTGNENNATRYFYGTYIFKYTNINSATRLFSFIHKHIFIYIIRIRKYDLYIRIVYSRKNNGNFTCHWGNVRRKYFLENYFKTR